MSLYISTNQKHLTDAIIIDVFQAGVDSHPDWFENEVNAGRMEVHQNDKNPEYCHKVKPNNNNLVYVFSVPREYYICILKSNTSKFHKIRFDEIFSLSPGILQKNFKPYIGELDRYLRRISMRFDAGTSRASAMSASFQEGLDNDASFESEFGKRISMLGLQHEAIGSHVLLILDGEVIKDDLFSETELDVFLQGCELGIKLKNLIHSD